ncbi:MAG: L-histidine N(alpha)-methyltransferase [Sphingobacteriaceae bacterium]|nr:MAG: L-histidine N(alpha)-methyltransferase [Sphingobacteriaceae bacterium]
MNTSTQQTTNTQQFYNDVMAGLQASPKYMQSKYFYDTAGDKLFQDIMNCEEYYPTNCEMEIFAEQTEGLANAILAGGDGFDLIELGAGDAIKSSHLLQHLLNKKVNFTYLPIDISDHVIDYLNSTLPLTLPGLKIDGLNGDYFDMLKKAADRSNRRKVVLFLGSNVGNMPISNAEKFCRELRNHLSPGDMVLLGIDLKKNPKTILAAYNDKAGITKKFNLNLLERINRELNADFNLSQFDHYPTYDPETGSCKSYLVSLTEQTVKIDGGEPITFLKNEHIFMEISQKYTVAQADQLAKLANFETDGHFYDKKQWFLDVIWIAH